MPISVERADGLVRIRLSQWAKSEGVSIDTAYRMLRRGLLPVTAEQSPTGRWYVLVSAPRAGRLAFYVRASPGRDAAEEINRQLRVLVNWAGPRRLEPFVIVREIADPLVTPLRRLGGLLSDREITTIVIERAQVVGDATLSLLTASLTPQARSIVLVNARATSLRTRRTEIEQTLDEMMDR